MIPATISDKPLVIEILTKAFDSNRSVNYVIKQDKERVKRIKRLMEYSFELCFNYGEVLLDKNKQGVVLLLYPWKKKTSLKTILLDISLATKAIGFTRISKVLARESTIKKNHPERMIYLWFIAVTPHLQGKGTGTTLLHEVVKRSNTMQLPVFLETSMEQNLPFYCRAGFNIFNTVDFDYKLYMLKKEAE